MGTKTKAKTAKPPAAPAGIGDHRPRFSWKPGTRVPVPATVAGAELDRIRESNAGALTAAAVVDAARHPDSPLHKAFNWNDDEAAEMFRQQQARHLIHSIRVTVTGGESAPPRLVYVNVTTREAGRAYLPADVVLSDDQYRDQAVGEALAALEGWRRRYADLRELSDLFAAIDRAARPVTAKRR